MELGIDYVGTRIRFNQLSRISTRSFIQESLGQYLPRECATVPVIMRARTHKQVLQEIDAHNVKGLRRLLSQHPTHTHGA